VTVELLLAGPFWIRPLSKPELFGPFWLAFYGWCFAEWRLIRREAAKPGQDFDRSGRVVFAGTLGGVVLGLATAAIFPGLAIPGAPWGPLAIGLALVAAGIALRAWAAHALGRFFRRVVGIEHEHVVVEAGPYRVIRHPAYAGTLLTATGIGIASGNWACALICFALPALGHLPRITIEEAMLESHLGEAYSEYARRTRRLVPWVW
jgi:protein-S-isoprenylcysteine O-methyltransferase Ste14